MQVKEKEKKKYEKIEKKMLVSEKFKEVIKEIIRMNTKGRVNNNDEI